MALKPSRSIREEPNRDLVAQCIIDLGPHNLFKRSSQRFVLPVFRPYQSNICTALIRSPDNPDEFIGIVSDRSILAWFDSYGRATPSFKKYLSNPIQSLSLPSLNLNAAVISASSSAPVLDAMKLMSEEGVSSIAVVDEHSGNLLSAVSVTDIGKVWIPLCRFLVLV